MVLRNNTGGYFLPSSSPSTNNLINNKNISRNNTSSHLDLLLFSSLPWVDYQLVKEWHTCDHTFSLTTTNCNGNNHTKSNCNKSSSNLLENKKKKINEKPTLTDAQVAASVTIFASMEEEDDDDLIIDDNANNNYNSNSIITNTSKIESNIEIESMISDGIDDDDIILDSEDFDHACTLVPKPIAREVFQKSENCYTCNKLLGPTLLWHHCHLCGYLLCQIHSSYTHKLPHPGYDAIIPERVCDNCKTLGTGCQLVQYPFHNNIDNNVFSAFIYDNWFQQINWGHACSADVISLLLDVKLSSMLMNWVVKIATVDAGLLGNHTHSIIMKTKGVLSLLYLSGFLPLPDEGSILKDNNVNSSTNKMNAYLQHQKQLKKKKQQVLVTTMICYGQAANIFAWNVEQLEKESMSLVQTSTSWVIRSNSSIFSFILWHFGDECNKVGKVLLNEVGGAIQMESFLLAIVSS